MEEKQEKIVRKISECDDVSLKYRVDKKRHYSTKNWFALFVHPGHEFQIYDYLMGIDKDMEVKKKRRGRAKKEDLFIKIDEAKVRMECFVAAIPKRLKYADRELWKYKLVTPGIVFVNCVLDDRDHLFHSPISEFVTGFLNDRERHWPQPIPEAQMQVFRGLIEEGIVESIGTPSFEVGQKVLVLSGPLQNRVAELTKIEERISRTEYEVDRLGHQILDADGNPIPKHKVVLSMRLNAGLAATFEIDADQVVPAPEGAKDYDAYL